MPSCKLLSPSLLSLSSTFLPSPPFIHSLPLPPFLTPSFFFLPCPPFIHSLLLPPFLPPLFYLPSFFYPLSPSSTFPPSRFFLPSFLLLLLSTPSLFHLCFHLALTPVCKHLCGVIRVQVKGR